MYEISDENVIAHFKKIHGRKRKFLRFKKVKDPKIVIFGEVYTLSEVLDHMEKKTPFGLKMLKIYRRDMEWEASHK